MRTFSAYMHQLDIRCEFADRCCFLVNGLALMHMYYAAYETKGHTLEEIHEAFDSGLPPWKFRQGQSRIEELAYRIQNFVTDRQALQVLARASNPPELADRFAQLDRQAWPFIRGSPPTHELY